MTSEILNAASKRFFAEIERYGEQDFTGRLNIRIGERVWRLYLTLGRLGWVDGGIHPLRRWHRQVDRLDTAQARTEAARLELALPSTSESLTYAVLLELIGRKHVGAERVRALLRDLAQEALFDALWFLEWENDYQIEAAPGIRPTQANPLPHTLLPSLAELNAAIQQQWGAWCERGLKGCRPSWAPAIVQPEPLKLKTNPATFQMLTTLLDGKRTLRDIAAAMQRELAGLTLMLMPYVQRKWIAWRDVADFTPAPASAASVAGTGVTDLRQATKTIVAVDDSPQALQFLEAVATGNGYRFIGVSESIEALTVLLEHQPDMIFIDAVMPVMSGYELCQAIRKVEALRRIPIVLISGNLIDQVRAMLAGADECITKPATVEQLAQAMQRHSQKQDATAAASPAVPSSSKADAGKVRSVACVDDCNLTQKVVKTVVTTQGYRFLGIAGSLEAIASLIEFQPDLILLDLVMPTMDGYELCQRLREYDALKSVPIIIFSGNPIDREQALAAGVTAYFNKPLTPEKMNQALAYIG